MVTYNEYCTYFGEYPEYSEICPGILKSVRYACLDVFNDPTTPKIDKEGNFATFVQIIFNWSHYNECKAKEEGRTAFSGYYSKKLKAFGTTLYEAVPYFAKIARVSEATGYRWIKILIKKELLKKEKMPGCYGKTYYLMLDKLKETAEKVKNNIEGYFFKSNHETYFSDGERVSSSHESFYSHENTKNSHDEKNNSHDDTYQIYINKKNKKTTTTNPEAQIGDVDPNSYFSFSQEEDPKLKNQLDIENRSNTSEVKNLEVQPEKKLFLPSSSKKEEVKVIADKHLSIKEPPNPPLTKKSTPGTKEESTTEKPTLAVLHLNTEKENSDGFIKAAFNYRLVCSEHYHREKVKIQSVPGNECLYYITWAKTDDRPEETFLYVADYLASSTVKGSKNYWRADYLSWTWEKEACWWTALKNSKNTQSAIYELAQMHSRWLSGPDNKSFITCLSNRFLCFAKWEAEKFPVINNMDQLTLNEADKKLIEEMKVEIHRLRSDTQLLMHYREAVTQYLTKGGYNFEWEGFTAHDTKLCMNTEQSENLELLPVLGCYDNLIEGGKLQYFSVRDPETGKGKENKLTKFGNAGYPLNFFVGEFIKKYSKEALPEDILVLLKEQAKIGLGLVDNSGKLESDR